MALLLFAMVTNLGLNVEFTAFLKWTHFHLKSLGWGWNSALVLGGCCYELDFNDPIYISPGFFPIVDV